MKTHVYITVDTESSMGGAWDSDHLGPVPSARRIFCRINGNDYGVGWQCDELARRGFRATFFCEVLSSLVLGEDDSRAYFDFLLERGQDVQLHTHPNFYFYAEYQSVRARGESYDHSRRSDSLAALPEPVQRRILEQACELFTRFAGQGPVAYRAGGYQASSTSLAILSSLGILLDSSYNPAYQPAGSFQGETLLPNVPQRINGIWEIPVMVAVQNLPDPRKTTRLMPFEVNAISAAEMRSILDHAHVHGVEHVVLMFHSFSGVKAKDGQYSRMRPDQIVRRRFHRLLDYLAENSDRFTVSTFGDLAERVDGIRSGPAPAMLELGYVRPFFRKAAQLANNWYWL